MNMVHMKSYKDQFVYKTLKVNRNRQGASEYQISNESNWWIRNG